MRWAKRAAGEDLVGVLDPDVGLAGLVVDVDELLDGSDQLAYAAMRSARQLLGRERSEPALDQVYPGGVGRGEVELEAGVTNEPVANEGALMGTRVVEDDVHIEFGRHVGVDAAQKGAKLAGALSREGLRHDRARIHVQRRVQGRRAVAFVVVRSPLYLARLQRQEGSSTIEGLNLGLHINAIDHGVRGRLQVQPHDIAHFVDQQRIGRQLESLCAMRLEAERSPDAANRHRAQARRAGHLARAPVGRPPGSAFQGPHDHFLDLLVRDLPGSTRARLIEQSSHPLVEEAPTPLTDRRRRHPHLARDGFVVVASRTGKHDARPLCQSRRAPRAPCQRLELALFQVRQCQRLLGAARTHRQPPWLPQYTDYHI